MSDFDSIAKRYSIEPSAEWQSFEMPTELLDTIVSANTVNHDRNAFIVADIPAMKGDIENVMIEFYAGYCDVYLTDICKDAAITARVKELP